MANSYLTRILTRKIITEDEILHNLYMSKYVQQNMSIYKYNHSKQTFHPFMPLVSSYIPDNIRKPLVFLTFSGGIERDQGHEMGRRLNQVKMVSYRRI